MKGIIMKLVLWVFLLCNISFQAQDLSLNDVELDGNVFAIRLVNRPDRALFSDGDHGGAIRDGFYTSRWKKQFWLFEKVEDNVYTIQNVVDKRYLSKDKYENRGVSTLKKTADRVEDFKWEVEALEEGVFVIRPKENAQIVTFGDYKRTEIFLADYKDDLNQFVNLEHIESFETKKSKLFIDKSSIVSTNK